MELVWMWYSSIWIWNLPLDLYVKGTFYYCNTLKVSLCLASTQCFQHNTLVLLRQIVGFFLSSTFKINLTHSYVDVAIPLINVRVLCEYWRRCFQLVDFLTSWPFDFLHTSLEEGVCLFVLVSLYPGFRVKIGNTDSKMANFF